MATDRDTARYRRLYVLLLSLYPEPFRTRFGEGMTQTFNDLCRERSRAGRGLLAFVLRTFLETSIGILRERMEATAMRRTNVPRIALVTALLLLLPLLAMLFTDQVAWDLTDFAVAGGLLFGAGLSYDLVARKAGGRAHRLAVGIAVGAALLLVWMNLAVGLIGSENDPANLLYIGVVAVGILGAIVARLRPRRMAGALFVTALAQALVPVLALGIWEPELSVGRFLVINTFFVMLFVVSALLFRQAGIRPLGRD